MVSKPAQHFNKLRRDSEWDLFSVTLAVAARRTVRRQLRKWRKALSSTDVSAHFCSATPKEVFVD